MTAMVQTGDNMANGKARDEKGNRWKTKKKCIISDQAADMM
jgi:hypothetical protein